MKPHSNPGTDPKKIVLLSDSTGDLGERMVRALVSQFPKETFVFQVRSFVARDGELEAVFRGIVDEKPIIFHTTISGEMKHEIAALARKNKLPCCDLTGFAMKFLEKASGIKSRPNSDALHEMNPEYDKRIAALSFTVEHDDGLGLTSVAQADLVLLGISRVSKTPTSIYLGNRGFKVANVPLVKGFDPETFLKMRPRPKFVGLVIKPYKLREIRLRRAEEEKIPHDGYTDLRSIEEELKQSHLLFLELRCPIIDVTDRAVEETAALVLKALSLR